MLGMSVTIFWLRGLSDVGYKKKIHKLYNDDTHTYSYEYMTPAAGV